MTGRIIAHRHRLVTDENRRWWTLGAMCFALFMLMLDNTVVNVALPSIQRDLHATLSGLEWTINAYTLTLAVLMVTGGRLGDIFGRRRMFLFGLSGPINSRINRQRWLDGTQSSTEPLSAQLTSAEKASFSSLPASESPVTASLHQNLEIVDNYISLCENSVREEPENELAREYLYEAYQQKADLLAQLNEQ